MSHLYPPLSPYHQEMLQVSDNHQLHLELSGNPNGTPILVLHGGPGAGLPQDYRRLFDPNEFHIIGFDQRGSGRSTPFASIIKNSTQDLLKDIETIRQHLNIHKWVLYGGSWGATLALLTAIGNPDTVKAILLRGVFLAREEDFDWFLAPDGGAAQVFPDHYADFIAPIGEQPDAQAVCAAYTQLFSSSDELIRMSAVRAWCFWEEWISRLHHYPYDPNPAYDLHRAKSLALLECHYIRNRCFISENFILENLAGIDHIPGTIIHGRYDMVCKTQGAYALQSGWKNSKLMVVPNAGHSLSEPAIADAVCQAADALARFLREESA